MPSYAHTETVAAPDFIRENHPGWDTEFGACDRCVEVYKLRADGVM